MLFIVPKFALYVYKDYEHEGITCLLIFLSNIFIYLLLVFYISNSNIVEVLSYYDKVLDKNDCLYYGILMIKY